MTDKLTDAQEGKKDTGGPWAEKERTFHATFTSTDKKIWNEKCGFAKTSLQLPHEDT